MKSTILIFRCSLFVVLGVLYNHEQNPKNHFSFSSTPPPERFNQPHHQHSTSSPAFDANLLTSELITADYELTILPADNTVFIRAKIKNAEMSDFDVWMAGVGGLNPTFMSTANEDEIEFSYIVPIEEKEKVSSPDAYLDSIHFRTWGWNIFIYPVFEKPTGNVTLSINTPEKWSTATSFGVNQWSYTLPSFEELLDIAIVSGDFHVDSFKVGRTPVYLAVREGHDIPNSIFIENLRKLIETSVSYTGASIPKQLMFGIGLRDGKATYAPGNNVRTGSHSSTIMIDPDSVNLKNPQFLGTYAHELSHTWIPSVFGNNSLTKKEMGSIFKEGFTDYLAYKIAYVSGVHNKEQFAWALSKFYLEYWDVASSIENEQDVEFLNYRQGMMAAWLLDIQLQKETKGKVGFKEMVQALIEQHSNSDGLTKKEFISTLTGLGGEKFAELYLELTNTNKPIDFYKYLKGTGIMIKDVGDYRQALKGLKENNYLVIEFEPSNNKEEKFIHSYLKR